MWIQIRLSTPIGSLIWVNIVCQIATKHSADLRVKIGDVRICRRRYIW